MDLALAGKRALITGGTKGIGRAIAACLVGEGCHVALCARQADEIAATVEQLSSHGTTVLGDVVDVRHTDDLRAWVARSGTALGGIDIVISNVSAASGDWQAMFETDLLAAKTMVDAALPSLERSGTGSIVAISSRAAYTGGGAYAAMKCALMSYMKGVSDELASKGIRANVVSPGDIYFEGGVWHRIEHERPDVWADAQVRNKMGRLGRPEEVARVVTFVASPAASFMSGANVRVDGAGSPTTQF